MRNLRHDGPMKGHFAFVTLGLLFAMPAVAQVTMPAGQTFPRSLEADELAPLPKPAQPVSASTAVSASENAASPFTIKGVVVTLSDTTGFARDEALEKAARNAMPLALEALPLEPAKAAKLAKDVGGIMRFVASYRVVKETVIPSYSLTADLTFNEEMLRKNFGGAVSATTAGVVDATHTADGGEVVASSVALPLKKWLVRMENSDVAEVSRVFDKLNGTAGTRATYHKMTSTVTEMTVATPLEMQALQAVVGGHGVVSAFEPVPQSPLVSPLHEVF